jgi:glutamate N-acetyltransferase/amino-acid N-acetyltransferase
MRWIESGLTAPKGYRASGVQAGIKPGSSRKDCALIVSDSPAAVAGMFTQNIMKAAPVTWCLEVCRRGAARAIFANSGNANACTGERGFADAKATAEQIAQGLGVDPLEVCVCSTGVIGAPLPMDRLRQGAEECLRTLSAKGSGDAAAAIMTTDTVPKELAVEISVGGRPVRIGGIAKGAGMLAPNMATLLCFLTTDATVEAGLLDELLSRAVATSFNRICVDNDMSTNDTVLCLANGQAGASALTPSTDEIHLFGEALTEVCQGLAKRLVRDGEGATKFVEISVSGTATDAEADAVARSIATSQLCKTAFYGEDPNWGRIACAAGYAGVKFDPHDLAIWLDDLQIVRGGAATAFAESEALARMRRPEFRFHVKLGSGEGTAMVCTSDLSEAYVRLNAAYRT